MKLLAASALDEFALTHPQCKSSLQRWKTAVKNAEWSQHSHVIQTFGKARKVGKNYNFKVHDGCRVIAAVWFAHGTVRIKRVLTHAQYEKLDIASL